MTALGHANPSCRALAHCLAAILYPTRMTHDAHAFRGEYIDLCAQVERWATYVMYSDVATKTRRVIKDQRYLFGDKLKVIRDLAEYHPEVFAKSNDVKVLMSEFAPFAGMRSDLAHATLQRVGHIYAFCMPDSAPPRGAKRFWLTPDDTVRIINELKNIQKQICSQKISEPVKAVPNPQPCSYPASSPLSASDISAPSRS